MKIFEINTEGLEQHILRQKLLENGKSISGIFVSRKPMKVVSQVAYIDVYGILKNEVSDMESEAGYTSYKEIKEEIMEALNDGASSIVLEINSSGGEAMGSEELANYIATVPVPTYAVVDGGICFSAAYKIASACTYILGSISSEFGSIGTVLALVDSKESNNNYGVYMQIFTNEGATMKSLGKDFGHLTEEQSQFLQDRVNKNGKRFQEIVKANRPEINEEVFNASFYDSQKSLELGLIDGIF